MRERIRCARPHRPGTAPNIAPVFGPGKLGILDTGGAGLVEWPPARPSGAAAGLTDVAPRPLRPELLSYRGAFKAVTRKDAPPTPAVQTVPVGLRALPGVAKAR
ncbi:MAG: hypothetical protein ACE5GS_13540 [Kiloniellaceae bacterium]